MHFHVCVVDGVFETVVGQGDANADADVQASPPGVVFHRASAIDADAVARVQATLRERILRAFVARGLLESCDAKDMLAYAHSGRQFPAGPPQGKLAPSGGSEPRSGAAWGLYHCTINKHLQLA